MNHDLEGSFVFLWEFPALSFFQKMLSQEILGSKKKKKRREEFGCVGIASHSQGALPNFQKRMVPDDRKTPTVRTGNSARHTKEGNLSG